MKHKDDIDSCPHENADNTSKSELPDISMANRSTSSERSRAFSVRKLLPKQPMLRCHTVIRMFLHELSQPATREIMLQELRTNKRFQNELLSISMLSSETKEVNSMIRNVKSLALKIPLALKKKVTQIKKKYTLQKIQLVTGMCYSEVHKILNPKSSKGGVRKIFEVNKLSVYEVIYRTTHSMRIPYRRFTKYFYLWESIKETYKAYAKEQEQLGL